jgi:pimeloyl-ACP methyl ester carboxylesterase
VNLYYEEYGTGPAVILTPGGRVDRNGLRPIAALLSPQCRVILHDRRNCGRSDVIIGGELSEQHQWAEDMAALLKQIGAAPAYAAGGSAGSRTSLTLAVRHPEVVKGVFIWEVSGGPRSGELMAPGYYGQYIEAAERGGMAAVAETEFFAQRLQDNPSNRERLLSMDVQAFCAVMRRCPPPLPPPIRLGTSPKRSSRPSPVLWSCLPATRLMTCTTYRRRKTCIAWSHTRSCGPQPGRTRSGMSSDSTTTRSRALPPPTATP